MAAHLDKFERLTALRPAQGAVVHQYRSSPEDSSRAGLDECTLAKLLGATVSSTKFGNHLSIRNWYATPELPEISSAALDLLCRTPGIVRTKKWREAANDPEKWLFLDTET